MKGFSDKLIEMAITVVVVAISLRLAWQVVQPLVPVIAIVGVLVLVGRVLWRYRQDRYW